MATNYLEQAQLLVDELRDLDKARVKLQDDMYWSIVQDLMDKYPREVLQLVEDIRTNQAKLDAARLMK